MDTFELADNVLKIKYATDYRWLDALTGRAAEYLLKKHNISKNGPIKLLD